MEKVLSNVLGVSKACLISVMLIVVALSPLFQVL